MVGKKSLLILDSCHPDALCPDVCVHLFFNVFILFSFQKFSFGRQTVMTFILTLATLLS